MQETSCIKKKKNNLPHKTFFVTVWETILFFYLFILLLFNYTYPNFPPVALPCPANPPPPQLIPTVTVTPHPCCPCPWVPWLDSSPSFPCYPLPPPWSWSIFFLISLSLALFYSFAYFVLLVPIIGEIIWRLYFTTWLLSLSIILSSSIYAVAKGRIWF